MNGRQLRGTESQAKEQQHIKRGQWVRLKRGIYKDDLAQVDFVDTAQSSVHLKLIPRQVVGIVKENPAVLNSYDAFWAALAGPD